jgi:hypothetical protein
MAMATTHRPSHSNLNNSRNHNIASTTSLKLSRPTTILNNFSSNNSISCHRQLTYANAASQNSATNPYQALPTPHSAVMEIHMALSRPYQAGR